MAAPALAAAAVFGVPLTVAALFLGSGAGDPPPPDLPAGTVCTVTTTGRAPTRGALTLSAQQVGNARTVVAAAKALGLPQQAAAVGVMTARQESSLEDLANPSVPASEALPHQGEGNNYDSLGLFQQRPSMGWGTVAQLMDPGYASTAFLHRLAALPGWATMPAWQAAQAVQHSADGSAYAQWTSLGSAVTAALWTGTGGTLTCTTPTPDPGGPSGPLPAPSPGVDATVVAYAQAQLGKPYLWGGAGPNAFDCSGLVWAAYAAAGVTVPRTSDKQYLAAYKITEAELVPGDLVFYNPGENALPGLPGHVAIFVGAGQVIQAPHTGAFVEYTPVHDGDPIVGYGRPVIGS